MHISRPAYNASLSPRMRHRQRNAGLNCGNTVSRVRYTVRYAIQAYRIARIALVSQSAIQDFPCLICENVDRLRAVSHVSQEREGLIAA